MTHDELIAKLDFAEPSLGMDYVYYRILKDIVKLHKPIGLKEHRCNGCLELYPCPTVQIIERKLI